LLYIVLSVIKLSAIMQYLGALTVVQ
jgi:hypothetical protein